MRGMEPMETFGRLSAHETGARYQKDQEQRSSRVIASNPEKIWVVNGKRTYLCQSILLLGSHLGIAKEKSIVLKSYVSGCASDWDNRLYLVEQLLDLLELLLRQLSRVYALDFTTEVGKLGRVRRWRQRERSNFNGHSGGDVREESCLVLICRR